MEREGGGFEAKLVKTCANVGPSRLIQHSFVNILGLYRKVSVVGLGASRLRRRILQNAR